MISSLYYRNATNCIKLQTFYRSLTKNVRQQDSICSKSFHFSFKYPFKVNNIREYKQQTKVDKLYAKTNVKNNVLLYKYEGNRYLLVFKIASLGLIILAIIVSYYSYNDKFILTWTKDISLIDYVKLNGTDLLNFVNSIIIGPCAFLTIYAANKRFIKYIVLHKGGKNVSLITEHFFKHQETLTLPVNAVTAIWARNQMKDYLPLKVEGKLFYYLLDARGTFLNEELFDSTIGLDCRDIM